MIDLPDYVTPQQLAAACAALGLDPADVYSVYLRPLRIVAVTYVRGEDGQRVIDPDVPNSLAKAAAYIPVCLACGGSETAGDLPRPHVHRDDDERAAVPAAVETLRGKLREFAERWGAKGGDDRG